MSEKDKLAKIEELKENIRQLEELKSSGKMPSNLADASISAFKKELATYEAKLDGDGAIAQGDGAKAVGENGVLVEGDLTIHQTPDSAKAKAKKEQTARQNYLNSLYRRCQSLPLVALGDDPNASEDVRLEDVYIALHTTERIKSGEKKETEKALGGDKEKPLPAFDAFLQTPKMVLLGDPGSGKSTFVRNLLALQAQVLRGEREALEGVDADLLPILVTLRDLIGKLSELNCKKKSAERRDALLVSVVDEQIKADLKELYRTPEFAQGLRNALRKGRALLAFDGLDEVPEHLRENIRLAVSAYQKAYALPRVIITCRIRSYRGSAEQPGFKSFTLALFTQEQARNFCTVWYEFQVRLEKITAKFAKKQAQNLARAAWRDELQKLAENPMLLTTMAIIHQKETRLPDQRVKLYRQAVRVLTKRWQEHRFGEALAVSEELAKILKDDKRIRKILERLAYEAHRIGKKNGKKSEADLLRKNALDILEGSAYLGEMSLAIELLNYIDLRSGLLVGRGGEEGKPSIYSFAHRTFQEYLAGCHLVNRRDSDRELLALASEAEYWSLAVEFGTEELYYNGRTESQNDVLDLAYKLLAENYKEEKYSRTALWSAKMAALVGAEMIKNDPSPYGGESYFKKIIPVTTWLLESDLTPVERTDAGRALAKLGDPRPGIVEVDDLEFCLVPAGQFWMGSEKGDDDEKPQHVINLPTFWISRHPISNAQFNVFVNDGGYMKKRFWAEAREANMWLKGEIDGREEPKDFGDPFHLYNHPVVGITWYEALAFVRWLDLRWHRKGVIKRNWHIGLPSEAEWEKAARGGIYLPLDTTIEGPRKCFFNSEIENEPQNAMAQRVYPWGDKFDTNYASASETHIRSTSPHGAFVGGKSPYGVEGLSGNIEEWTRSLYKDYLYTENGKDLDERENMEVDNTTLRVLRGGSFIDNQYFVRCSYRGRALPFSRNFNLGFRLVIYKYKH